MQSYYTPDVAADLRTEPILLFDYILGENRSLIELLNADYTFLTERLVKFYQLEGKVDVQGNEFKLVKWPDNRRGGVIEMGAVLAMTSHYEQTSPVLRGAWALETLLGTPVPPPPPNVPPLDPDKKLKQMSVRQKLEQHRADPSVRRVSQADGPDRICAGEFRLDGALAREGKQRRSRSILRENCRLAKSSTGRWNCGRRCSIGKTIFCVILPARCWAMRWDAACRMATVARCSTWWMISRRMAIVLGR